MCVSQEICQKQGKSPRFFVDKFDRFDINQGEIGNCWFLAALANLAENENCFSLVVPKGQDFDRGYCGAFRFRFWRFGQWVEVVVDDRLPTRGGKLIYIRSTDENEFWSALLEKAYAKMHGSYKALEGGLTIEAAVDFTGGIPELIDLTSTTMSEIEVFHLMKKAYDRGAFLGCALGKNQVRNLAFFPVLLKRLCTFTGGERTTFLHRNHYMLIFQVMQLFPVLMDGFALTTTA